MECKNQKGIGSMWDWLKSKFTKTEKKTGVYLLGVATAARERGGVLTPGVAVLVADRGWYFYPFTSKNDAIMFCDSLITITEHAFERGALH